MQLATSAKRFAVGAVMTVVVAAGCTSGATPTPTGPFVIPIQLTPSHVSVAVAAKMGFFEGIDLQWQMVGYGESSQLFHAGTNPIGNESAWEAATYQDSGEDVRFFSTAEALNFISGIIIRTEDKAKYPDLNSLKGKKVGMPGFGTGTWAAFQTISKAQYGLEAKTDFEIVEGNPGDLEGLLQTKAVEAMITFTAQTAHAIADPNYTMLYNITDEWKKSEGCNLTINGWIAHADWLDAHQEVAKNFVAGIQKGLEYFKSHPEVDDAGGDPDLVQFAENEGRGDAVVQGVTDPWIKDGYYYLDAGTFTQSWADCVYKFIQQGEGVLVDSVPAKDKVFYLPLLQ